MTPRQRRFIQEYLVTMNATAAAIKAGYSSKTAYSIGQENLKKPEISAAIKSGMDANSVAAGITAQRVLQEIGNIAFSNIADFVTTEDGILKLRPLSDVGREAMACVSEVSENGHLKLKRHDKVKALELLGRHLGLWTTKIEITPNPNPKPYDNTLLSALTDDELAQLEKFSNKIYGHAVS